MTRVSGEWLTRTATQALFDIYEQAGHSLYVVGGCVRNALMGEDVTDIDMASDAPPDVASTFLQEAGVKVVPTGIDHGTLTAISDGIVHEVTTFRKDVETDGRHAVVAYSHKLQEDAARRDFTINALYADRKGLVHDPENGLADIVSRRVRFIGVAEHRIREDYLRILRYFRFHARYGDPARGADPEALAAITANLDGLQTLSRERVGAELLKLLAVADPAPAVALMSQTGVLAAVLPGSEPRALAPLVHFEQALRLRPDPIRRLSAISGAEPAETLRLSRMQMRDLTTLRGMAVGSAGPAELGYRLGRDLGTSACALRHALLELPLDPAAKAEIEFGAAAEFPISASDLQPSFEGPALGEKLQALESAWIASGFTMTRPELLR